MQRGKNARYPKCKLQIIKSKYIAILKKSHGVTFGKVEFGKKGHEYTAIEFFNNLLTITYYAKKK